MQRSQFPIIVTVIIMAVIAAVGLFLAVSYIQRRPDSPAGSFSTTVEGVTVTVNGDPAQQVRIVNPPAEPQAQPGTTPSPPDTATDTPVPPTDTPVPTPEPTATRPEPVVFIDYVVQPNDTMYSVSLREDTSIALMAQEGIAQDNLVPGQTIRLPIGNTAYCPGRRPYAVGEDETAFSISQRYNISLEDLKTVNNLGDDYKILAGQILCVP